MLLFSANFPLLLALIYFLVGVKRKFSLCEEALVDGGGSFCADAAAQSTIRAKLWPELRQQRAEEGDVAPAAAGKKEANQIWAKAIELTTEELAFLDHRVFSLPSLQRDCCFQTSPFSHF